jgi:hypothetical protein
MNVRGNVGLHAGAKTFVAERFDTRRAAVVKLTEHDERIGADVADVTRRGDEADDAAQAAENVFASED